MFWSALAVACTILALIRFCMISVRQDTVVIMEDIFTGKRMILKPGLHACSPFWTLHHRKWKYDKDYYANDKVTSVSARAKAYIKTNVRQYDPDVLKARTKDQVDVEIDLLCFYKIADVMKAVTEVDNLKSAIAGGINTEVYRRVAEHDHQELNHADLVGNAELKTINKVLLQYGISVTSVRVEGIRMPENIAASIEDAVAQRQVGVTELKAVETQNDAKIKMAKAEMELMELEHTRELATAKHEASMKQAQLDVEMQLEKARFEMFKGDNAAFVSYKQTLAWAKLAETDGLTKVFAPLDALQMSAFVTRNDDKN